MMKIHVLIAVLAVLLIAAPGAMASWIAVDPDAAPAGTIINNYFSNVTLTALGEPGVLPDSNVYATASPFASTGANAFGNSEPGLTGLWGDGLFDWLRADFGVSVSAVSLDFIPDDAGGDANAYLEAYDLVGNLLASATTGRVYSATTLTVTTPGIAYIEASWDKLSRMENGVLDNLQYNHNVVPVPGALVLSVLGVGLIGVVRRMRRL